MRTPPLCVRAIGAFALVAGLTLQAQPIGQWDFNSGNLTATVGQPLTYSDGDGGATSQGTQFGATTALGIPDIGGTPAQVMRFPAGVNRGIGYNMPVTADANGGGTLLNQYTLIMDVLFPAESTGQLRALLDADAGFIDADSELFISAGNQLGVGNFFGSIQSNTWYRIGLVADTAANRLAFYINGVEVGSRDAGGGLALDGRWALAVGGTAQLFSDDDGGAAAGYVSSIQLRDVALSKPQMAAFGGAQAEGIPSALPPIPSFIERWIPAGQSASRTTPIGAVIDRGSTTIDTNTIALSLNDTPVTGLSITPSGSQITVSNQPAAPLTPGTVYTIVLSYTDSLDGQRSLTNSFTAALFFEDFEGLPLGPRKDDPNDATASFERGWTHTPPSGWSIDNSQFPATVISDENPDSDGDGYADLDGITEWAGWSFADKNFWVAAEDQTRSQFALGQGTIAVADTDEWDDSDHFVSLFNSLLKTPPISLEGIAPGSAFLRFASSWRPEALDEDNPNKFPVGPNGEEINNQTAIITASYDGGEPVQILKWDSISSSPTYKDHSQSEQVQILLNNPAGATNVVITFALVEGGNDWWWAIDNVVVNAGTTPPVLVRSPLSLIASAGLEAKFTVEATGEPLQYQWQFNETNITGATSATLNLPEVASTNAGSYRCVITNPAGSVTSDPALLTVVDNEITDDLVVHLKFDNDLLDSSGRNNPGTAIGAPTFNTGQIGSHAVRIPSGEDYVTLGAPADLNFGEATDFTISFWAKLATWSSDPPFISNKSWDSGGNPGYVVFTSSGGTAHLRWNISGPPGARKDSALREPVSTNEWHHLVVVFQRNQAAYTFVDGELLGVGSLEASANNVDTPENFATNIGQDGTGGYDAAFTDLDVDDLGIWRRALSAHEVAAIHEAGLEGKDLSGATLVPLPVLVRSPLSQIASAGLDVAFTVQATGESLQYQWQFNGTNITGATSATLNLTEVSLANTGGYLCVITNPGGSISSEIALLTIIDADEITDDLVVHLKFDNDLADSSGRNNPGTAVGTPTFNPGQIGSHAVRIPSGTDYVTLGAPADLNFGEDTDFTISFWAKLAAWSSDPPFIGNKDWGSGGNPGYVVFTSSGGTAHLRWNISGPPGARKDSALREPVSTNEWHHLVVVFQRNQAAYTFVDGKLLGFGSLEASVNNVDTPEGFATNIGQDGTGSYGAAFTDLDVDDLGIWRRALSAQEVGAIYLAGLQSQDLTEATLVPPPQAPGLITGQWDFDEGDLRATVGAPLHYRGDIAGGTTFVEMQIGGQPAKVMGFPGATRAQGYIMAHGAVPNGGGARVNQYTLIMDVMYPAESNSQWRGLLQTNPDNTDDGDLFVNNGNGLGISGQYHGPILPDTWYRLAVVFDLTQATLKKYIDGALVNTQALGGSGGVDQRWSLGPVALLFTDEDNETSPGFVNSIQFRNSALSDAQIAALGGATASGIPDTSIPGDEIQIGSIALDGNNLTITWTGGTGPFQVQKKTALTDATWQSVATTSEHTVSVPLEGASGFFVIQEGAGQ